MTVLQIGPHRVRHGDIMEGLGSLMDQEKAAIVYTDPPWGQAALSMWQTLNTKQTGAPKKTIDHALFLRQVIEIAVRYGDDLIFIEYGLKWKKEVLDAAKARGLNHLGTAEPKYMSGGALRPMHLHVLARPGGATAAHLPLGYLSDLSDTHGAMTSRTAILPFAQPGEIVLDPCCGGGYTARAALAGRMHFRGQEINAARLDRTIEVLRKGTEVKGAA